MKKLIVILSSFFLASCLTPETIVESEKVAKGLMETHALESRRMTRDGGTLHYVVSEGGSSQDEAYRLLVFIHGTPGDWKIFAPQLQSQQLLTHATLVGIDRPGWGLSDFSNDELEDLSLAAQSAKIGPFLSALKGSFRAESLVLVGHSLGGSLVPRLAMDFPELVDGLVVLAGDITEQYPVAYWYNEVASWKIISWMLPGVMRRANQEVLLLPDSLAGMRTLWANLESPMLVIQGEKDGLVDPRHADFAETLTTKSVVQVKRFPEGGHLLHLKEVERVNAAIIEFLVSEISRL